MMIVEPRSRPPRPAGVPFQPQTLNFNPDSAKNAPSWHSAWRPSRIPHGPSPPGATHRPGLASRHRRFLRAARNYASVVWIVPVVLCGRMVRLEPLEPRHAADLLAAADPELFRHTPQAPPEWSVRGFEQEIESVRATPGVVPFAIILTQASRAIGRTTFMDIRPEHRGTEIGRTWITRPCHGTPVNPEIKYLMLRHAFEQSAPPAVRVQFTTSSTNLHSQRAIARLGAVREGTLRRNRLVPAGPDPFGPTMLRDTVVFSILDAEWPAVKRRLEERIGWSA